MSFSSLAVHVRFSISILVAMFLVACTAGESESPPAAVETTPDATLYHGGTIITMDGDAPAFVDALVEQKGMIAYIGPVNIARDIFGAFAREVDLKGQTMLPGFIDPHGHITGVGTQVMAANLLPAPDGDGNSFDQLVEITRAWMESDDGQFFMEETGWVLGFGYDDSQLEEQQHPTADVLDRVSTEHPVYFVHQSGHLGAMNSKAIELMQFDADSPDPDGGTIRRRDNGEPSGVLEEMAHFAVVFKVFGSMDEQLQDIGLRRGQEIYASFGYTTAQDGRSMVTNTQAMQRAAERDELILDIVAYPDIMANHDALPSPYYGRDYSNKYRIGGYKLNLDGSPQGKTAWLTECYYVNPEGQSGCYKGYPTLTDEQAEAYVADAIGNDIQILVHVNGDAAIDQLIGAVRKANESFGTADRRTVAIHSQTIRDDQLDAYLEAGIFPALFPMHTFYWGDWHASSVLGPERAARISPAATARKKGLRFTSHHDAPVALPSSIRVLASTVNRTSRSGQIIGPDERVSPYVALKSMTDWAAYQHFEEDRKGTLTVGKVADFVILDRNPLDIPLAELEDLEVSETIFRGETIYSR